MQKIGIIQADSIDQAYQAISGGDYPEMFSELFKQTHQPFCIEVFNACDFKLPNNIDLFSGFIITGSRASAYDPIPWIQNLTQFILKCHAHKKPLIGICFGHQIIAQTLGGCVTKAECGWGVGMHTLHIRKIQSWMRPEVNHCSLVFSHQDQVTKLPDHAILLAESPYCAVQMYQIGHHILGIQGHPEMNKLHINQLMIDNKYQIQLNTIAQGRQSLDQLANDGQLIGRWMIQFLKQAPKNNITCDGI